MGNIKPISQRYRFESHYRTRTYPYGTFVGQSNGHPHTGLGAMYLRDMVKELKGTKVWDDFKCFFFCGHNNITQMIKAMEKVDVIKVSKNGDYIVTPRKRTTLRAKFDSCIRVLLESNGNSLAIPEVERKIKRMYGISFRHTQIQFLASKRFFNAAKVLYWLAKS